MGRLRPGRLAKMVVVVGVVLLGLAILARILIPRFMVCLPVALRGGAETGCWVTARRELGLLPNRQVYCHIARFPDRASADAAGGSTGTIVESYGKVWLFTISADGVAATAGEQVAVIGPLPTDPGGNYMATYM